MMRRDEDDLENEVFGGKGIPSELREQIGSGQPQS